MPERGGGETREGAAGRVMQIRVDFLRPWRRAGQKPAVWRRLLVPAGISLSELHHVLRIALGWREIGGYGFATAGASYVGWVESAYKLFAAPRRSARRHRAEQLFAEEGDEVSYLQYLDSYVPGASAAGLTAERRSLLRRYADPSDGRPEAGATAEAEDDETRLVAETVFGFALRPHRLRLEAWLPREEGVTYPLCTGGSGQVPDPDPACTGAFRTRRVSALLQGGYERRRAEERWRTRLLRAAYFLAPGEEAQTAIPCPRAAEDRRCTGRLRVRRFVDDLGLVGWSCPACGAAGELPGLDRLPTSALFPLAVSGVRPPAQEQRVRLEAEAYEALGDLSYVLDGLSPSFDRARWADGQVELPGPPAHLLELANLARRGASRARGRLARRLDEAAAVIERQVLPLNGPEGEEPDEELEEELAALDLHSDLDSDEGGEKEPGGGAADAEQLEAALRALAGRPGGGFPHSLSVAPAPALTEASLRGIAHLLDSQTWSSPEEASAFLESAAAQAVLESVAHRFGDSPLDRAQALAYEAWEADPPRRYELAREALRLSEDCSDAWLILAETEERWQRRKRLFERALSAAAHALQVRDVPAEERTYANVFARPYVRAKVALARCLVEGRFLADAERLYLEMLRDDPDDPMGIRFELGQTYHHMAERSDAAGERGFEKLAQLLDAQEDDPDSWMRWERLWLALVRQARGLPGGSEEAVRKAFDLAFAANPHVPDFLLLREEPPATADAPFMALGSPEEAANYVFTALRWWAAEPATLARLAELMEAKAGEREGDRGEAEDEGRAADDKRGR